MLLGNPDAHLLAVENKDEQDFIANVFKERSKLNYNQHQNK